ncbi:unnamed protein product [Auanema sp. JU1783]|nr:unnamed protein product [Auanema sp. JU1783]
MPTGWSVVCVTVHHKHKHDFIEKELELLRKLGVFEAEDLLVVEDPCSDVGSAGSTLNALLIAAERVCYRKKQDDIQESVFDNTKILIILMGSVSNAFTSLSNPQSWKFQPDTVLSKTISNVNRISGCSSGVWIAGTNCTYDLPHELTIDEESSLMAFAFQGNSELAKTHGSYLLDDKGDLKSLSYCSDNGPNAAIILSLLYMSPRVAKLFLSLSSIPPIAATTYHGEDAGLQGMRLSLFFDLIQSTVMSCHDFMANDFGQSKIEEKINQRKIARAIIYDKFNNIKPAIKVALLENYRYLSHDAEVEAVLMANSFNRKSWADHLEDMIADPKKPCKGYSSVILGIEDVYISGHFISIMDKFKDFLSEESPITLMDVASIFSRIAHLMILSSKGLGGINTGPAANPHFSHYFEGIRTANNLSQVKLICRSLLIYLRKEWSASPFLLVRGARHAEAAVQVLISRQVMKEYQNVFGHCHAIEFLREQEDININLPKTVLIKAAARIDLCGGWLDTPPITFAENNPCVINMAVLFEGRHPLSCYVERCSEGKGVFVSVENQSTSYLEATDILRTSSQPTIFGSIFCACIVAVGIVKDSNHSLSSRLKQFFDCEKIIIQCKSHLSHGSGMGGSSILASCIIEALLRASGLTEISKKQIVYTVLCVEQLLTTGGGWQDQVGGIYPGIKHGTLSQKGYNVEEIPLDPCFENEINERLVLVDTGTTRLAKNMLQVFVRGWFTDVCVQQKLRDLSDLTERMRKSFVDGVFPSKSVEEYLEIKKYLTSKNLSKRVNSLIYFLKKEKVAEACWFPGAGGGGYLCIWLCKNVQRKILLDIINEKYKEFTMHEVVLTHEPVLRKYNVENDELIRSCF